MAGPIYCRTNEGVSNDANVTSGYVGIGTTDTPDVLTVQASNAAINVRNGSGTSCAKLGLSSDEGRLLLYDGGAAKLDLKANGSSYFIGGSVGVGSTSPSYPLDVVSSDVAVGIRYSKTGSADARIQVADPGKAWSMAVGWHTQGDFSIIEEGAAGDRLYIKQGGFIGMGTSNPQAKLDVRTGDIRVSEGGKGIVLTDVNYVYTKRVRLNNTGDGLIFENL